jgi:hypothetical protein
MGEVSTRRKPQGRFLTERDDESRQAHPPGYARASASSTTISKSAVPCSTMRHRISVLERLGPRLGWARLMTPADSTARGHTYDLAGGGSRPF